MFGFGSYSEYPFSTITFVISDSIEGVVFDIVPFTVYVHRIDSRDVYVYTTHPVQHYITTTVSIDVEK